MKKRADFDDAIEQQCGYSFTLPAPFNPNTKDNDNTYDLIFDEVAPTVPEADIVDEQWSPLHYTSMADALMKYEVLLPQGKDMRLARVIQRSVDSDGKVTGEHNNIPMLNTILYDV